MGQSKQFNLNGQDWGRWARNVALFASPLVILFLTQLQQGVTLKEALPLLYAALIQAIIDIIRKFVAQP